MGLLVVEFRNKPSFPVHLSDGFNPNDLCISQQMINSGKQIDIYKPQIMSLGVTGYVLDTYLREGTTFGRIGRGSVDDYEQVATLNAAHPKCVLGQFGGSNQERLFFLYFLINFI